MIRDIAEIFPLCRADHHPRRACRRAQLLRHGSDHDRLRTPYAEFAPPGLILHRQLQGRKSRLPDRILFFHIISAHHRARALRTGDLLQRLRDAAGSTFSHHRVFYLHRRAASGRGEVYAIQIGDPLHRNDLPVRL